MDKSKGLRYLKLIEKTRNTDPAHEHEWRMIAAFTAEYFGYESRNEWTKQLKEV